MRYQNETDITHWEKVAPSYFFSASVIWIVPHFLFALILSKNLELRTDSIFKYSKDDNPYFEDCLRLVILILLPVGCSPVGTVISFLFAHLILPLNLICNAGFAVIKGEDFDEEEKYGCLWNAELLTVGKCLEIFGRALPQLILNIVFMSDIYPYLKENDTYCGIPISLSIVSAVFSIGSLVMGCIALVRCCLNDGLIKYWKTSE